jgi:hypothetical protein
VVNNGNNNNNKYYIITYNRNEFNSTLPYPRYTLIMSIIIVSTSLRGKKKKKNKKRMKILLNVHTLQDQLVCPSARNYTLVMIIG